MIRNKILDNYTSIDECENGAKIYRKNGFFHRSDGPAIEYPDGTKHWYINGKHHRLDGPAIEWDNGFVDYWIEGEHTTKEGLELFNWLFPKE